MDVKDAVLEENVDHSFVYGIYGVLVVLGISFLFSLVKAIYDYYKERAELNVETTLDSTHAINQSMSSNSSELDRRTFNDNKITESDRLHTQLDKLRRLLNRLNAMGTFSRDTIGDLSTQTTSYGNISRIASSDLTNFWSSIDFDDLEESTMIEDNFQRMPTEKSVSLSVSGFSLDTSGRNFDNLHSGNTPTTSKENILNTISSAFGQQTNPSDAIAQIVDILDSILLKNRHAVPPAQVKTSKIEQDSKQTTNIKFSQSLIDSKPSTESHKSQEQSVLSSSQTDNRICSRCDPINCDTNTIDAHNLEYIDAETDKDNMLTAKCTSYSESKTSCVTELPKFSKSSYLDNIAKPSCISISVDPTKILHTQAAKHSDSSTKLSVPRNLHVMQNKNFRKISSETNIIGRPLLILDKGTVNRSHSYSNFSDNYSCLPIQPNFTKSCSLEIPSEKSSSKSEEKSDITILISDVFEDSQFNSPKHNELFNGECENCENSMLLSNNNNFSSFSSNRPHMPLISDIVTLKSSISDSDMMQTSILESLSPNISSSDSASFSTPILSSNLSPDEKIDWKSPLEPYLNKSLPNKLCQQKKYSFSKNISIWSTPPS